jgi:cbb3-type cytochrome oxidase subunit 3
MSRFIDLMSTYGLFLGIPILFLLIIFWVYRPSARRRYREDASLPFAEGEKSAWPPPPSVRP